MTHEHEAQRQRQLLDCLLGGALPPSGLRQLAHLERGLQAYRAGAGAAAERALAAAYPTLQQLLGAETLAAIAPALWRRSPPTRGDLARWGGALPDFIADCEPLADHPYLADMARLDWALHRADSAADSPADLTGLARLGDTDPQALWLLPRPGSACIASAYPIVTLWRAHRSDAADRFDAARSALAAGRAETALVWRRGWRTDVALIGDADRSFTAAVCDGLSLAVALHGAAPDFDFSAWLQTALQQGWLVGVESR
jgi:hypothetical protein